MKPTTRLVLAALSVALFQCTASPGPAGKPKPDSAGSQPAFSEPLKTESGTLLPIARIEGFGDPATGELWIREVPSAPGAEARTDGVESSAQALSRPGGYCELTVDNASDPSHSTNPANTFEFYTIGMQAGAAMADLSSFNPATCQTKLEPGLDADGFHSSILFPSTGSGCAFQRVKNFYDKRFNHVYMDIDVWNGNYATNGPYGPGFTNGTITTRPGRRAPSEALGLWDFGPVEAHGAMGDTVDLWIFFKNAPGGGAFNFTGHLVGELIDDCSTPQDEDCDGVVNNNCGTVAQGAGCFSDEDCQPGLRCSGAQIQTKYGAANMGADVAGSCTPAPAAPNTLVVGNGYGCSILPAGGSNPGSVKCWGTSAAGGLGQPSAAPTAQTAPLLTLGSGRPIQLTSGGSHNCAVFTDGTVRCWGSNNLKEAHGSVASSMQLANSSAPPTIEVGAPVVRASAGVQFTCVLRDDGGVRCWGTNVFGQLGASSASSSLSVHSTKDIQFQVTGAKKSAIQLCSGAAHSCALLDDGSVMCWGQGSDGHGKLGYGNGRNVGDDEDVGAAGPVSVLSSDEIGAGRFVTSIACGGEQTCALTDDGSLRCWGDGSQGALGYGSTATIGDDELPSSMPFVGVGGRVKQVEMDDSVTCALLTNGQVKCWGWTGRHGGCLGYPNGCGANITAPPAAPIFLGSGLQAVQIASSNGVMCAQFADGGVKCWGGNAQSQSGYGDTTNPISPPRAGYTLSAPGNNAGDPCQGTLDCTPGNACYSAVCVHEGRLRFALSWTPDFDLDLHVVTPGTQHVFYGNRIAGGGELDVDDCAGSCNVPGGEHLENVAFTGDLQQGTYTFYANAFNNSGTSSYKLKVFLDGRVVATQTGMFTASGQDSPHFTFQYPEICGDGYLTAGETCDADDSVFNGVNALSASCSTYDHTALTGDDRGGIAMGQNRVVYTGDSATVSFDVNNLGVGSSVWPSMYDGLTSDLATGQLWALGGPAGPFNYGVGTGGLPAAMSAVTVTKIFPVDESTGAAGSPVTLSQPVVMRANEAGIFAGPTFIALYGTPDNGATRHVYVVHLPDGHVEDMGTTALQPNAFFGCENWSIWGVAEVINDSLYLSYVKANATEIARTRLSDGATATVTNFGNLGHMCAITVQPSTNRWIFHQEHDSVIVAAGAGNEVIGVCAADLALGSPGQTGCDAGCNIRTDFTCVGVPSVCTCTVSGSQDNDHDGDCNPSCATAGLSCSGNDLCDDRSGTAACVATHPITGPASLVLGQVSMLSNAQATSATGMNHPEAVAIDPNSYKVFVADSSNNRVLRFASVDALISGAAAERVFGQTSFISSTSGSGLGNMSYPGGLTVDSGGRLWVVDRGNGRVLRFNNASSIATDGASANGVLGKGVTGASAFDTPIAVVTDGARLWVSDINLHRVLRFENAASKADNADADGVLGQTLFTTATSGNAATAMNAPTGIDVENDGTLWVADANNSRVLRFANAALKDNGAAADSVLGQSGFDTSSPATTQSGISHPQGVTVSDDGWVYVPEYNNKRLLGWHPSVARTNGANATIVIGAPNFTTVGSGPTGPATFGAPAQSFYDEHTKSLWLADYGNHRVLRFGRAVTIDGTADLVLGQPSMTSSVVATTGTGMSSPSGVAVDPVSGKVFVADFYNSRVLRFASREALTNGAAAEGVLGQSNFTSGSATVAVNRMNFPVGVFVDLGGRLWVADGNNRRVLRFDGAATKGNGANADAVLGASNFTSAGTNTCTQSLMGHPSGLFADAAGRLWVADDACGRVLRFDNAAALGNGANASGVLGQPTFTEPVFTARGITQTIMSNPEQVWLDSSNRLWVADQARVLRFDDAPNRSNGAAADGVLGQPDFTTFVTSPVTASSSHGPKGVVVSGSGWVYMSHQGNQRITIFDPDAALMSGAAAVGVIGQANLTSSPDNPVSATSMWYPDLMFYDTAADRLWLCDTAYNRVLAYDPAL